MRCLQELCINWSGDGRVCPCSLFDLESECGMSYGGTPCGECSKCQGFVSE